MINVEDLKHNDVIRLRNGSIEKVVPNHPGRHL